MKERSQERKEATDAGLGPHKVAALLYYTFSSGTLLLRARSHMHWGFASATRFGGSEPGVAPAKPRVYGHTCKQGTTPTLAENESKVDCGTYGTENRRGLDYLARIFVAWTSYAYKFLVASPYTVDHGVFR